jgi:hypothetical protein
VCSIMNKHNNDKYECMNEITVPCLAAGVKGQRSAILLPKIVLPKPSYKNTMYHAIDQIICTVT